MDYSTENLTNIFYSGHPFRADQQDIVDIKYLIDEKLLIVNQEKITQISDYHLKLDLVNQDRNKFLDFEGGDVGHIALKIIGYEYLKKKGYPNSKIKIEQEFIGYRPDIMTDDHKLLIECGNTETSKIFNYFQDKSVQKLVIIPYPQDSSNSLIGISFKPGEDLADFLIFREQQNVSSISQYKTR